ncbi:DNA polymerase III subunit delta [Rhodovarius crocodyli]|uniref:DNA-directed DNA polymerase n=1 Tax=Rhodovarius crocodyli TaxID=1979269 RepID=A0A437MG74_9PROT|nr:DNA polymerase III subunit delta [Rhodovarius crocodyli]RVT96651.1 DNA polymerase III subunit delta [Rhodovarius crocodyli]
MAKLDPKRIDAFLKDPGDTRVVLLHGDDAGLVRERAALLARNVTGGDDLSIADIPREGAKDTALLSSEAATRPLLGGRRAVRVREATDAFTNAAKAALDGPGPGVVIMEGPELQARSKLRSLLEGSPKAAVIACWRERGAELAGSAKRILEELGVSADGPAIDWLVQNQGEDRLLLRRELEKLALYVGPGNRATEEDVLAVVGEANTLSLDEALNAAFAGDVAGADRALAAAVADGAVPVQIIRAALRHTQRLLDASMSVADGMSPGDALGALRPPVFFRSRPIMERALRNWRQPALQAVANALLEAERRTKTTGMPDKAVARQAVLAIAQRGAARR